MRDVGDQNPLAGCGRVPSAGGLLLSSKAVASTPLYTFRELAHRLLRNGTPTLISERSFGIVDRGKDFRASALALLPKGKRFLDCVFLAHEPATFNCLAGKRLLVGSQIYFHSLRVRAEKESVKGGF